jgi:hypothetical protein
MVGELEDHTMTQAAQEARELLQWWLDYYEGLRPSAGLKARTKKLIDELPKDYVPTAEETFRMENDCG